MYLPRSGITLLPLILALSVVASARADETFTREVSFGEGNIVHGQIDRPKGPGPFPLVFLLPAGGGVNRHGTSQMLPALHEIYTPIVEDAVQNGWAVFRYDRFVLATRPVNDAVLLQDALAALRTALDLPAVDRSRVVLIANGYGTRQIQNSFERFIEIIGHQELKATVLLASEVTPPVARTIPGNILIINGEADGDEESPLTGGAVSAHRQSFPETRSEALILPGCNHALCDTTLAEWQGMRGAEGSCRIPSETYRAVSEFLRRSYSSSR